MIKDVQILLIDIVVWFFRVVYCFAVLDIAWSIHVRKRFMHFSSQFCFNYIDIEYFFYTNR